LAEYEARKRSRQEERAVAVRMDWQGSCWKPRIIAW
jgi:hypothetical protein